MNADVITDHGSRMHTIGVRHGANMAVYIVRTAASWAFRIDGDAAKNGEALGHLYRLAHEAVDMGAEPSDVRAVLAMGLRAGRCSP